MSKDYISIIREGIEYLPTKDINIANRLISNREFEELRELVTSVIFKESKKEISNINTDRLAELNADLAQYITLINGNEPQLTIYDCELQLEELDEFKCSEDLEEDFYEHFNEYDINSDY